MVSLETQHVDFNQRLHRLEKLAADLMQAEQRMCQRVGQTLQHDCQPLLVAARLQLEEVRPTLRGTPVHDQLAFIANLLNEAEKVSSSLITELCPAILFDGQFPEALRWLARWFQERHGLTVHLAADPAAVVAREELRIALFHGVRELLLNVIKHSGVRQAHVSVTCANADDVSVEVTDDGQGFNPEELNQRGGPTFGLAGIRERLEALGGSFDLQSAPGQGTRFLLRTIAPDDSAATEPGAVLNPEPIPAPPTPPPLTEPLVPGASGKIRVLVVDDHSILREGLCRVLAGEEDIEVVATAADGLEAVELAEKFHPDVITMDVAMPRLDGVNATSMITTKLPGTQVIGLSMIDEEERQAAAMRAAGAVTYLKKTGLGKDLLAAIRACSAPK